MYLSFIQDAVVLRQLMSVLLMILWFFFSDLPSVNYMQEVVSSFSAASGLRIYEAKSTMFLDRVDPSIKPDILMELKFKED